MIRLLMGFGGLVTVGVAVVFELDRHVCRMWRIWRQERRRKAKRGYML